MYQPGISTCLAIHKLLRTSRSRGATTRQAGRPPTALLGHYYPLKALPNNTRSDFGKGDIIPAVETAPPGARPPLRPGRGRSYPSPQDPAPAPSDSPARTPARTTRTGGERVGIEVTLIRPLIHRPSATRPAHPARPASTPRPLTRRPDQRPTGGRRWRPRRHNPVPAC